MGAITNNEIKTGYKIGWVCQNGSRSAKLNICTLKSLTSASPKTFYPTLNDTLCCET